MTAYSFKKQFIVPICLGLGIPWRIDDLVVVDQSPKLQTIRAGVIRGPYNIAWSRPKGGRRHAKRGEEVQLYYGMRTKQCWLIGRARCVGVRPITMWFDGDGDISIMLDGKLLGWRKLRDFARADGFTDARAMAAFWKTENKALKKWEGVVITWEPIE